MSPGQLSNPHHFLDGPLKCTSCHVFGVGKPKLRCLHCHAAIRTLLAEKKGYHGRVVNRAKGDVDCARCHTEHYGAEFNIVPWPKSKEEFDHRQTGYALVGKHATLRCEQCHNSRHISAQERMRLGARDLIAADASPATTPAPGGTSSVWPVRSIMTRPVSRYRGSTREWLAPSATRPRGQAPTTTRHSRRAAIATAIPIEGSSPVLRSATTAAGPGRLGCSLHSAPLRSRGSA